MAYTSKLLCTLVVLTITSNLNQCILASDPDCSSQRECEQDLRVNCDESDVACCSGLLTGTDYKSGRVHLFQKGTCVCCEKCEIFQEEPPTTFNVMPLPASRRQEKGLMSIFSRTVGVKRRYNRVKFTAY